MLLANILLDDQQKPVNESMLVRDLPKFLQETAFLDRMRGIIPGWKIRKLTSNSFATTLGLKADFFGSVLISLRDELAIDQKVAREVRLVGERTYKRNEDAVRILASGLCKIQFPDGECSEQELRQECALPAANLRQYIWAQLYQLDLEYRQFDHSLQIA